MGIYYSYYLVCGYELEEGEVLAKFLKSKTTKEEGIFHMEDRFDEKTGAKLKQVKVWDKKPVRETETWYVIGDYDSSKTDYWDEIDYEEVLPALEKLFDCKVTFGFSCTGDNKLYFEADIPAEGGYDAGKITISRSSIDVSDIVKSLDKLKTLGETLRSYGFEIDEPTVMIGESIG